MAEHRRALEELEWVATDISYESTAPDWLWKLGAGDLIDRWGLFEHLDSLSLEGEGVTDEVLEYVGRFQHLCVLNLHDTAVTDAGLAHLAGLRKLIVLRLDGARITDAGLEHLVKLKRLEYFGLEGTLVTDRAMPGLARLPALRKLEVNNTAITPWGVEPLRDVFPSLEFEGNQFVLPLIHEAAKQGNLEQIAKQLATGVDVDLSAEQNFFPSPWEGTTPLIWAASRGKPEAVRYLIEAGADINAKTHGGMTPLMAAAGAIKTLDGDPLASLTALIEAGADLEATDHEGLTAIFYACTDGEHFDEPPARLLPVEFQLPDPFRNLRPMPGNFGGGQYDVYLAPMRHGDAQRLHALIDAGANLAHHTHWDQWDETVLEKAAGWADEERASALVEAGADITNNVLRSAASYGTGAVFELLLHAAGDEVIDYSALLKAAAYGGESDRKIRLLLAKGARVHATQGDLNTALFKALRNRRSGEAVTLLLEAGADPQLPEQREKGEETIFLLTAWNGPPSALRWLLERGYDVNERSHVPPHPTALILAARSKRNADEKVRVLLEGGADVHTADDEGTTPLLAASRVGNMKAIIVLADAGVEVNIIDPSDEYDWSGMTPLMYVASRGGDVYLSEETGAEAAKVLLEHGANPNLRNAEDLTARMLAVKIKNREVVDVIDAWVAGRR